MKNVFLFLIIALLTWACRSSPDRISNKTSFKKDSNTVSQKPTADVAAILAKTEVPILCYHNIRYGAPARLMNYTVTPDAFAAQMKALYDSGYKTILPDELYEYLVHGVQLPAKPVMITFDDSDKDHFTVGA